MMWKYYLALVAAPGVEVPEQGRALTVPAHGTREVSEPGRRLVDLDPLAEPGGGESGQ